MWWCHSVTMMMSQWWNHNDDVAMMMSQDRHVLLLFGRSICTTQAGEAMVDEALGNFHIYMKLRYWAMEAAHDWHYSRKESSYMKQIVIYIHSRYALMNYSSHSRQTPFWGDPEWFRGYIVITDPWVVTTLYKLQLCSTASCAALLTEAQSWRVTCDFFTTCMYIPTVQQWCGPCI